MRIEEFWRLLKDTGAYETPPPTATRSCFRHLLGWSDAVYYMNIFVVVLSARITTRQNRFDRRQWAIHSLRMLRAVERCGGHARLFGFENLRGLRMPVVYVANHMSMVETLVLPGALLAFGDTCTVVKDSLLRYPLFGPIMAATTPIAVTRKDPREDLKRVLEEGESMLRAGRSVLVFPQATRDPVFDPAAFNSLGVKLARRPGVPVVPVALKTDFQGVGRRVRDAGPLDRKQKILFRVGAAMEVRGTGRDTHEACVDFISSTLREWGATVKNRGRIADD